MDFHFTEEQESFRRRIREFIDKELTPELRAELDESGGEGIGEAGRVWTRKLGERGFLGMGWPTEYGGGGRSVIDQYIFLEETSYWGLPTGGLSLTSVGPTIMRLGNEDQKHEYLPKILQGEAEFAIGYTEPNAGTDLAAMELRAVEDGDDYVLNGQKIFTSAAHYATHIWLAARTDPEQPKHRGISLFIVPMNTPGITVRPLWTMGDGRTNETFFEDVRVPRQSLVGEKNRGWYMAAMALDFERIGVAPYGPLKRSIDELAKFCAETEINGRALAEDPVVRHQVGELEVKVQVLRLMGLQNASLIDHGVVPNKESSMMKVWHSELNQKIASTATQILGLYGQLRPGSKWAPLQGRFERAYRSSPVNRFGAGTDEIQRNIIAQRGLGLPR